MEAVRNAISFHISLFIRLPFESPLYIGLALGLSHQAWLFLSYTAYTGELC